MTQAAELSVGIYEVSDGAVNLRQDRTLCHQMEKRNEEEGVSAEGVNADVAAPLLSVPVKICT